MTLKERIDLLLRMALLVFILASAAFLSAITAIRFAIHGREVEMPNLVGKNAVDARVMLGGRGLGMKVADRVYSSQPLSTVVRQSPPPGVHMKVSQAAHVVLSLGERAVKVPAVEGKSVRAARIEMLRAGLQVGEISSVYAENFTADVVVQQDPQPGSSAASPRVNVLVSLGRREAAYVMPHLVGMTQAEAQKELSSAGLHISNVRVLPAPQWPHGTVIEQLPAGGARVSANAGVELQVAE